MSSEVILNQKKEIVKEIADKMKNAQSFVLIDYKGITVEQATTLREKARNAGIDYKVYKNTFMRFAAKESGYDELVDILAGPTAVVFCENDAIAPAKLVYDFVKERKLNILAFKGGVIDKTITGVEEITAIAQLPSKDQLIAKILGSINSPIANLVYTFEAIRKQKEEQSA